MGDPPERDTSLHEDSPMNTSLFGPSSRSSSPCTAANPDRGSPEPVRQVAQPVKSMNPNDLDLIVLHEHGDVTLIVGWDEQPIKALTSALRLASPVWGRMFVEPWTEDAEKEAWFPDDDLDAMLIVLRIAHLRFKDLPQDRGLEFATLVQLAVLCDKYDTVEIVRPFMKAQKWDEPWRSRCKKFGYEDWLMIAWTFGDMKMFEKVANSLHLEVRKNDKGKYIRDGSCKYLGMNMPLGILDEMVETREQAIKKIMTGCLDVLKKVERSHRCVHITKDNKLVPPSVERRCQAFLFGTLFLNFSRLQISARRTTHAGRLRDLVSSIEDMPISPYISTTVEDHGPGYGFIEIAEKHVECIKQIDFRAMIDEILGNLPSPIAAHHRRHIEIQAQK